MRSVEFTSDHSKADKAKRDIQELEEDLECTDSDPCGYCKKCKSRGTLKVNEKSTSKKQAKTMTAACKNAKFRKKVDIPKDVACDFHKADKGEFHESEETLPSADEAIRYLEAMLMAPRGVIQNRQHKIKPIHNHYQKFSKPGKYSKKGAKIKELLDLVEKKWRWENSHASDIQPPRWLPNSSLTMEDEEDTLNPPSISKGDEVKVGKFKNSKATVKGFKKDDHNQPVLKTNKGDKKLFNLRLSKIQPKKD